MVHHIKHININLKQKKVTNLMSILYVQLQKNITFYISIKHYAI